MIGKELMISTTRWVRAAMSFPRTMLQGLKGLARSIS